MAGTVHVEGMSHGAPMPAALLRAVLLAPLVVAACGDRDGDTGASEVPEADADTDADTDSDTDADTDADTDSDTDADTDSDTDADTDADADYDMTGMTPGVEPHACTRTAADLGIESRFSVTESEGFYVFETDEVPDHDLGDFPNGDNPYTVTAQGSTFQARITPTGDQTEGGSWPMGIALNGVTFDPSAALYWNDDRGSGWEYAALSGAELLGFDCNYAHVNPAGAYHYHGFPERYLEVLGGDGSEMVFFGYAADGYPIYGRYGHTDPDDASSEIVVLRSSYQLKTGEREGEDAPPGEHDGTFVEDYEYIEGKGDLDDCNGRTGLTPDFGETYHYVITDTWPYIPRCLKARAHSSWYGDTPS